jgi:hypothetical protein
VADCDDPNLLLARYDRVVNQIGKLRHYVFADASFLRNSDAWELLTISRALAIADRTVFAALGFCVLR